MKGRTVQATGAGEKTLLLVGGGHAHVAVLADMIRRGTPPAGRTVLLTPEPALRYSGMVPGWIAGQHRSDEGLVDLAALAARAEVELVLDRCVAFDPAARTVTTLSGAHLGFDVASFDAGGDGQGGRVLGEDPRLVEVRPIGRFVERLAAMPTIGRVVVAGGGAGGVELAFALRNRAGQTPRPEVILAAGVDGLLPGFAPAVRARTARAFARQGIAVVAEDVRFERGALVAGATSLEPADCLVAAIGSAAPQWVRASGIATDAAGFMLVDPHHHSLSHPHIFAAGDIAARADRALPRSGVHAVFAGPVLAANLRAALDGRAPARTYRPRRNNLYLMNTGDGSAIASCGPLSAEGAWVLALKHRIDKGWIAQYARLAGAL